MLTVLGREKKVTLHGSCFNCGREFCHLELTTPIAKLLLQDKYCEIQLYNQPSETKLVIRMCSVFLYLQCGYAFQEMRGNTTTYCDLYINL